MVFITNQKKEKMQGTHPDKEVRHLLRGTLFEQDIFGEPTSKKKNFCLPKKVVKMPTQAHRQLDLKAKL